MTWPPSEDRAARQRVATKWRLTAGSGTRTVVSFFKERWVKWRTLKGDAELAAARPADHARAPVRQGRLPGRARLAGPEARRAEAGDRQPAAAGQLPQGRRPPRDLHVLVSGGAGVAGDRGPHVRGVRAGGAGLARSTRSATPPRARSTAASRAEYASTNTAIEATAGQVRLDAAGQPAFTQFSSSNGGFTAAGSQPYLVAQQDPYDGWSGNANSSWTLPLTAGNVRGELPGDRHPDLDRRRHPRRQRRVGRPRAGHDAHRHGRLGAHHGRGLPVPRRAEVVLVHAAGHRLTTPSVTKWSVRRPPHPPLRHGRRATSGHKPSAGPPSLAP